MLTLIKIDGFFSNSTYLISYCERILWWGRETQEAPNYVLVVCLYSVRVSMLSGKLVPHQSIFYFESTNLINQLSDVWSAVKGLSTVA